VEKEAPITDKIKKTILFYLQKLISSVDKNNFVEQDE